MTNYTIFERKKPSPSTSECLVSAPSLELPEQTNYTKNMLKNEKGFGWVEVVVILAILGFIVLGWWSIAQSKKQSKEILKPLDSSEQKKDESPKQ